MFQVFKNDSNIDFMKSSRIWAVVSTIIVAASLIAFFTKGLNYGVDFTGGIELNVKFNNEDVTTEKLRELMSKIKVEDLQVQKFSDSSYNEYLIRVKGADENLGQITKKMEKSLSDNFAQGEYEIRKVDVVGPKVGRELKLSGLYALIYAMLGIFIYVAIRFDYKFSPGALLALLHDAIIIVGVFAVTQYQFTLSTVAALLTVIGYSVNDTIVIYDRIRETMAKQKGTSLYDVINRGINDTLSRSILTSFATMLVVAMLLIFGGMTLWDFSLALFVGVIVGTYSSIFIASPSIIFLNKLVEEKASKNAKK
jgi:preprotein translocase subunit SecF